MGPVRALVVLSISMSACSRDPLPGGGDDADPAASVDGGRPSDLARQPTGDLPQPPVDLAPPTVLDFAPSPAVDLARPPIPDLAQPPDLAPSARCNDRVRDGDESDVDCGGSCPACPVGATCGSPCDCLTNSCFTGRCVAAPMQCADGTRDSDETDVDCGGSLCGPCADGKLCRSCGDCRSGTCIAGRCQPPFPPGGTVPVGSPAPCLVGGNVLHFEGDPGSFVWTGTLTVRDGRWSASLGGASCRGAGRQRSPRCSDFY